MKKNFHGLFSDLRDLVVNYEIATDFVSLVSCELTWLQNLKSNSKSKFWSESWGTCDDD